MRPPIQWMNHDPRTFQECGPWCADSCRLPRDLFVSDMGFRPVVEVHPVSGAEWPTEELIHRVDVHADYEAAEHELDRRGYEIHDWHLDGEGLVVFHWCHHYTRPELRAKQKR